MDKYFPNIIETLVCLAAGGIILYVINAPKSPPVKFTLSKPSPEERLLDGLEMQMSNADKSGVAGWQGAKSYAATNLFPDGRSINGIMSPSTRQRFADAIVKAGKNVSQHYYEQMHEGAPTDKETVKNASQHAENTLAWYYNPAIYTNLSGIGKAEAAMLELILARAESRQHGNKRGDREGMYSHYLLAWGHASDNVKQGFGQGGIMSRCEIDINCDLPAGGKNAEYDLLAAIKSVAERRPDWVMKLRRENSRPPQSEEPLARALAKAVARQY